MGGSDEYRLEVTRLLGQRITELNLAINRLDEAIADINAWRYKLIGYTSGAAAVVAAVVSYFVKGN